MASRRGRSVAVALVVAVSVLVAAPSALAGNWIVYNFAMNTASVTSYGSCQYGTGSQHYRWTDSPPSSSRISSNNCNNLSQYGSSDYGAGDTSYHQIGGWSCCTPIILRGRSLNTAFYDHDGSYLF